MRLTVPSGVVAALLKQQYEPGAVIRVARTAAGWSQAELGRRCGYSASTVSRWETGRLPLRDVKLLRTLAHVLALPLEVFGLLPGDTTGAPTRSIRPSSHKVARIAMPRCKEDERVRRRRFLLAAGLAGRLPWPCRRRPACSLVRSIRLRCWLASSAMSCSVPTPPPNRSRPRSCARP